MVVLGQPAFFNGFFPAITFPSGVITGSRAEARAMAAAGGAAGKENDDDDEAAIGAQPTKRNSKDLPRGVVRVKKEYQARASWKPIGAIKAKQRHIACFTTIPEAAQAVRDTEALLAAGGNPWADRPVRKRHARPKEADANTVNTAAS